MVGEFRNLLGPLVLKSLEYSQIIEENKLNDSKEHTHDSIDKTSKVV